MEAQSLKVLLIEDDEDDYVLVRDLLAEISTTTYNVEWARGYEEALQTAIHGHHDVCLMDYRLGMGDGLQLLRELTWKRFDAPVIFLTGQGNYAVDMEAMKAGAADFLVKGQINASLLERSIRYAVEHKRSADELRKTEQRLRHLSTQLLTTQEKERKKIAHELHDGVGQILAAIKFTMEGVLSRWKEGDAAQQETAIASVIPLIRECIEEIRRIQRDLRPASIDERGIISTLGWFAGEFTKIYSHILVDKEIYVREDEVPEPLKIVIFRIIQEAFNNVAKHSGASRVTLSLQKEEGLLKLAVRDNGTWFDPAAAQAASRERGGLGLHSMKDRAELSGGILRINSAVGEGTVIEARWPLP